MTERTLGERTLPSKSTERKAETGKKKQIISKRGEVVVRSMPVIEDKLLKAATAILTADNFLFSAGAGFSADRCLDFVIFSPNLFCSGLAVYKDIANVAAYRKRGLDYGDLCDPAWLKKDADLFFGFWGNCHNDYFSCHPHVSSCELGTFPHFGWFRRDIRSFWAGENCANRYGNIEFRAEKRIALGCRLGQSQQVCLPRRPEQVSFLAAIPFSSNFCVQCH